jgi:hypothetical protein
LSGADGSYRTKLIGSNALISFATVIVALILIACKLLFPEAITNSGYNMFLPGIPCSLPKPSLEHSSSGIAG